MRLAERVLKLKPSATLAVNALAKELARAGRDIISLSVGEADFDTPAEIKEAAVRAIEDGFTKYTAEAGIPELRQAAADYFNRLYGAGAEAEHILIGNGGKQCLFNIMLAILNPGDEVLLPAPYWVSYPSMIEIAGGSTIVVPAGAERAFKLSVDDLERRRTAKTRACIMNSPSNPTGAVYSAEELDDIAAWAVEKKILLISDEIYDQLVYNPARHHSLCAWWKRHPENFVVVNGVSKSLAMTGWRLGYMLAHADLIKAAAKLQGQSTSNVCSIAQKGALAGLVCGLPRVEEMRRSFERRRSLTLKELSDWPDVLCPEPQGAFYVFPEVHRLYRGKLKDSASFCAYVLEKAGVAVVPGEAFGDDRCVRISYALDDNTLTRALGRMREALYN